MPEVPPVIKMVLEVILIGFPRVIDVVLRIINASSVAWAERQRALDPICSRSPKNILLPAIIQVARDDEKIIREAVEIAKRRLVDLSSGLAVQLDRDALCAANDGPREMQESRRRAAARQHEGFERRQLFIQPVDFRFEPYDLRIGGTKGIFFTFRRGRHAKIGADI